MGGNMYPNKDEFAAILRVQPLDSVLDTYLFEGLPYSFAEQPRLHQRMIRSLSRGLNVPQQDICIVGSARLGFSLAPDRYGEPFSDLSDLDVVIVSTELFDPSWLDILTNRRVPWSELRQATRTRLIEHREKYHVYNGWIYPNSVAEALDIGERWLSTFNGLSTIPDLSSRRIGGRLYRTWEHARHYHLRSLTQLRQSITKN